MLASIVLLSKCSACGGVVFPDLEAVFIFLAFCKIVLGNSGEGEIRFYGKGMMEDPSPRVEMALLWIISQFEPCLPSRTTQK